MINRLIGHRGLAGIAPENTLAGIEAAAAAGFKAVEFDVRLTVDGEPILMHDDAVDRTTDGTGIVADMTTAAIAALAVADASVPTLEDALRRVCELDLFGHIEIKAEDTAAAQATAKAVAETVSLTWPDHGERLLVSSFHEAAIGWITDQAGRFATALLVESLPMGWRQMLTRLGAEALHVRHDQLDDMQIQTIHDAGYAVRVYTVNDRAIAERLCAAGVDGIYTDLPLA